MEFKAKKGKYEVHGRCNWFVFKDRFFIKEKETIMGELRYNDGEWGFYPNSYVYRLEQKELQEIANKLKELNSGKYEN